MAEMRIWHEEQKTQDCKEYYAIIVDGNKTVSFILKHNANNNEVVAEPYTPPDINYTICDGCDHENDECVLDDPESMESQDVYMAEQYGYALRNLLDLEKQLQQQKITERLINKKRSQTAQE